MFTKLSTQEELQDKRDNRGVKNQASIRIHVNDKKLILDEYGSLQAFIDACIDATFYGIPDSD